MINKLFQIKSSLRQLKHGTNELQSFHLLSKYFPKLYFPSTGSAILYHSLCSIINDIVLHKRKNYIEFGAGLSTIIISKFIKINRLSTKVYSIEHNKEWIDFLSNILKEEELEENIKFIYAPLTSSNLSLDKLKWHDESVINDVIQDTLFDSALIDGPPERGQELARYPAVPFIWNHLQKDYIIFLDDVNRKEERAIYKLWKQKFNIKFRNVNYKTGYSISNEVYNFIA